MRTEEWNRETFRTVLAAIRDRTHLTELELASMAGRSRSQVNRWTRAENQPDYEPVRRLVDGLERFGPEARDLGVQLLAAAGYAPPEPVGRISQVELNVPESLVPGVRVERDAQHLHASVILEADISMDEAIARLGPLTANEHAMVAMLKGMGHEPAEVAGAVLLLRGLVGRQTGDQDAGRRKA